MSYPASGFGRAPGTSRTCRSGGGNLSMSIRVATEADVEALFEVRTSVAQNYQSREELAGLGVTPQSIAEMLRTTSRVCWRRARSTRC